MALYDLTDGQVKNIKSWLENIPIQANRKQRKEFDIELDKIFEQLDKPIQPAGKPKEEK